MDDLWDALRKFGNFPEDTQFIFVMLNKRVQLLYLKKLNKLINTYILLFSNGIEKILQNIYF